MAANEELLGFVKESLSRGARRADVEAALTSAGWERGQVAAALRGFAEIDFPVPVPRPRPYLDPRDAFLYLVLFGTLYVIAINLGTLAFQLIDRAFPDPAIPQRLVEWSRVTIRWAISALIVAVPVFALVARITHADIRRDPAKHASRIRRWLTYLTMAIASAVLIGDLIALVNAVLGGGLVAPFVLKVLSVGVIAGGVLGYYLIDLRKDERDV
ncbi:MAG TPA: DUF5671 domain-containing protein [Vicinamibacterales bacterium]|nr:DUF5671 domain-containing protein [Vicinamibacterales bacterium]